MKTIYIIIFFIYGTVFGSFFTLVADRLPNKKSIINPPSHCDNCLHNLKWYDLIPIFSYFFRFGHCHYCHCRIPFKNVLIEMVTGILFAVAYNSFGFSHQLVISLIFISTLIIVIISDIEYMIILDEVLLVGSIMIIIYTLLFMGLQATATSLGYGALSFMSMYLLKLLGDFVFKKESLGGGDIKLMFLFGLVLGYSMSLITLFLATFLAFPIAIYILLSKKENIIPFGPFLSIASLMILMAKLDLKQIIDFLFK